MTFEKYSGIFQLFTPEGQPDKWILQITCGTLDGPEKIAFAGEQAVRDIDILLRDRGEVIFSDLSKVIVSHYNELDEFTMSLLKGNQAKTWIALEQDKKVGTVNRRWTVRYCMQYAE